MYDWENSETREGLYKGMAHGIENLAVDWVTGNVYWTDSDYKWIMVADKVITNLQKNWLEFEFQKWFFGANFKNGFFARVLKIMFLREI